MRYLAVLLTVLLLTGCAQSGYKRYYYPQVDVRTIPDVELLKPGQEPQVFGTDDFQRDINILRAKRYVPIGYSSFNGTLEDTRNAAEQAKVIGATIVLVSSEYTETLTTTSTLFVPDTTTTFHSGSGTANTIYSSGYGGYAGSGYTNLGYSGTSTTYGTKAVPYTTHERRFDQHAVYLVKSNQKVKYGVSVGELTPEQRTELERNTGAFIDVVIEDTPAFYSNVMVGDVLISIDGITVKNGNHALELMAERANEKSTTFRVIRKGVEKDIKIEF